MLNQKFTTQIRFTPQASALKLPTFQNRLRSLGMEAVRQPGIPWLYYCTLALLFLDCSRLPEFLPHVRLMIPLQLFLIVGTLLTLRFSAITRLPSGRILLVLTAYSALCIPFSIWPGGAMGTWVASLRQLLEVIFVAAFVRTTKEAIHAMYAVGLAMGCASLLSFVSGSQAANAGRLQLAGSGTLGDPNYYCYYLLAGLPFLILGASLTSGMKRMAFIILTLPVLIVVAKTGSRGGALALGAGLVFTFLVSPVKQKAALMLTAGGLLALAVVFMPSHLMKRFTTIFSAEQDTAEAQMAIESTESRQYILRRSLEVTADHPILGVGPGMFMEAENRGAIAEGKPRGDWHASHNTYTQYSSEVGIPGALLFIAALLHSYGTVRRLRKSSNQLIVRAALATQVSFVMVMVSIFFLSIGYGGLPYVLIALSGVLHVSAANEPAAQEPMFTTAVTR